MLYFYSCDVFLVNTMYTTYIPCDIFLFHTMYTTHLPSDVFLVYTMYNTQLACDVFLVYIMYTTHLACDVFLVYTMYTTHLACDVYLVYRVLYVLTLLYLYYVEQVTPYSRHHVQTCNTTTCHSQHVRGTTTGWAETVRRNWAGAGGTTTAPVLDWPPHRGITRTYGGITSVLCRSPPWWCGGLHPDVLILWYISYCIDTDRHTGLYHIVVCRCRCFEGVRHDAAAVPNILILWYTIMYWHYGSWHTNLFPISICATVLTAFVLINDMLRIYYIQYYLVHMSL